MFDLKALLEQAQDQELALLAQHINPAFARVLRLIGYDIRYTHGRGAYLYDAQGNRYIDCLGGYAVFNCGRNHPTIRQALTQALELELPNLTKMGVPRLSGMLAQRLLALAPGNLERVFFTNSGAEGVETALKYARIATGRQRLLYCHHGFHGLSLGALSVNGNAEFRDGVGPLLEPCTAIPFNNLAALERELAQGDVAAFIVEPIQGKGVILPTADYLPAVAELCRAHGALLIADEVQTGLGRTGKMFACQHWGVEPDILIVAKALSGGFVPVGAVLTKAWIHQRVFSTLDRCVVHSTTFGQNDLAMVAGLAALQVLEDEQLVANAAAMGDRLLQRLAPLAQRYQMVRRVRGKGLMVALELCPPANLGLKLDWTLLHKMDSGLLCQALLIPLLREQHILAQVAGHGMDVIKLIPPLVLSAADVDRIAEALDTVLEQNHAFPGPLWSVARQLAGRGANG